MCNISVEDRLRGIPDIYHKIEDAAADPIPVLPWDRIASFGSELLKQADEDLNNAIKHWPIKDNVESFRATFQELLYSANAIQDSFTDLTEGGGMTFEDISDELGNAFQTALKELEVAFPPPDQAPSHETRQNITRSALQKAEQALLGFARKHDVPEDKVEALRVSFARLVPIVEQLIVITGVSSLRRSCSLTHLPCHIRRRRRAAPGPAGDSVLHRNRIARPRVLDPSPTSQLLWLWSVWTCERHVYPRSMYRGAETTLIHDSQGRQWPWLSVFSGAGL